MKQVRELKSIGYYLALDVGTHAVKSALVDEAGVFGEVVSRSIGLNRLSLREIEQSPNEILEALTYVISAQLLNCHVPVIAAGLAIQRSTVVAWDVVTGEALSSALSWQDSRGFEQVEALNSHRADIERLSGLVLSPHYGASKIRYLQQNHLGENVCISPLVSYLIYHLLQTPKVVCDESNAGRTQLWNLEQRKWDAHLCSLFNILPKYLPEVLPVLSDFGRLKGIWTQGKIISLTAVAGDQNAALSSVLSCDSHSLLVNIGSGAFILGFDLATDIPKPKNLLHSIAYSDDKMQTNILEGTVNGAGLALTWFANTSEVMALGGESWLLEQLHCWLTQEDCAADVRFYNSVAGIGSPFWRTSDEPYFEPQTASVKEKAIAVVESIVFLLVINARIMLSGANAANSIYVSGGVSKFDGLCQRLADLLLCDVVRGLDQETTLYGIGRLSSHLTLPVNNTIERVFHPKLNVLLQARFFEFYIMMKRSEYSIVAHRGYAEKFPENSLLAISQALEAGVTAVEFDIQFTRDGVPVVFHDFDLRRLTGREGTILDLTFEELQMLSVHESDRFGDTFYPTRIPSLEAVVNLIKQYPSALAFPEIKDEVFSFMSRECALTAIWKYLSDIANQCNIISFDLEVLRLVQAQQLCPVGWVLSHYNQEELDFIKHNPVDIVICNQKRFPEKNVVLWDGPWKWFAYEISSKAMMVDCLERGVHWIESRNPIALFSGGNE